MRQQSAATTAEYNSTENNAEYGKRVGQHLNARGIVIRIENRRGRPRSTMTIDYSEASQLAWLNYMAAIGTARRYSGECHDQSL